MADLREHVPRSIQGPTKNRAVAGIPVATARGVRPLVVTSLILALLLFGLGRMTRAGHGLTIAGFINATEQEASEGYFELGNDAMVVVKPGSGLQRWLKTHSGQRVRVTLEPAGPEN